MGYRGVRATPHGGDTFRYEASTSVHSKQLWLGTYRTAEAVRAAKLPQPMMPRPKAPLAHSAGHNARVGPQRPPLCACAGRRGGRPCSSVQMAAERQGGQSRLCLQPAREQLPAGEHGGRGWRAVPRWAPTAAFSSASACSPPCTSNPKLCTRSFDLLQDGQLLREMSELSDLDGLKRFVKKRCGAGRARRTAVG
jgi:hypothetical protein